MDIAIESPEQKKNHFYVSIIVVLLFPLLPIIIEIFCERGLSDLSLCLTTALYGITVWTTSKDFSFILLSIVPGVLFSALYVQLINMHHKYLHEIVGVKLFSDEPHDILTWIASIIALLTISVQHGAERYKRHYLKGERFYPNFN